MWSTRPCYLCPATRPLVSTAVNCTSEHLALVGKAMAAVRLVLGSKWLELHASCSLANESGSASESLAQTCTTTTTPRSRHSSCTCAASSSPTRLRSCCPR